MNLVCAADDFPKFWKIRKIINLKNPIKINHKQNVKCLVLFQVDSAGLQLSVLEFDKKNALITRIFFKKLIFAFLNPNIVK